MFATNLICMVGCILMATSFQFVQFIIARLVLGVGIGGYTATVPVWQSEISPPSKRGSNVVTDGVFVGAGVTLGLWIDLGFYFVKDNSASWRVPFALPSLFCILAMAAIPFMPESPRWLIMTGQLDKARHVMAALQDLEPDCDEISDTINEVQTTLAVCGNTNWTAMFTNGEQRLFHRAYLAATGQFFQQMCGVNLITYYATSIFQVIQLYSKTSLSLVRLDAAGVSTYWFLTDSPLAISRYGRC